MCLMTLIPMQVKFQDERVFLGEDQIMLESSEGCRDIMNIQEPREVSDQCKIRKWPANPAEC